MFREFSTGIAPALLTIGWLVAVGCGGTERAELSEDPQACIARIFALDTELGTVRNHASEDAPLAAAIRDYASGLEALDFHGCPDGFREAFEDHRRAWDESIPFFEQHGELRGELHDLFEAIRSRSAVDAHELKRIETAVWDTWSDVEAAAGR